MEQYLRTLVETNGLEQGHIRFRLRGQFTSMHGRQFRLEFDRAVRGGYRNFEIDFMELSYLDSTALADLIAAKKHLDEIGGTFQIVNPRKLIRHIFVSASLDQLLNVGPVPGSNSDSND